ncbi:effector-associated constant component EACC1 [Amycolatopsis sp. cmx-11-12]|uniref:effector-associated constant component EACC1 n=1 Tax=Amycolatopsis sp. cmx-11-12 TaxID=2785795 RepID=UPI003917C5A3
MELTINAAGDEQGLKEFYNWLRDDADVARSATISSAGSSDSGHMGAFEVICMSIGSLTGLANLGIAWGNFLHSRKETPPFTITIEDTLTAEQCAMLRNLDLPLAHPEDVE